MNAIKEKRNALAAAQEKEKEENLTKKLGILERMKYLTESQEDTNKIYDEFKKLQQEWNEVGQIPVAKVNELWKTYQLYTEKFYDMVKLNNEFREYDFKKNLEQKHACVKLQKNWLKNPMSSQHSTSCKSYTKSSVPSALWPKICAKQFGHASKLLPQ